MDKGELVIQPTDVTEFPYKKILNTEAQVSLNLSRKNSAAYLLLHKVHTCITLDARGFLREEP